MGSAPFRIPDFGPAVQCDHAAEYQRLRLLAEQHGVVARTGMGGSWVGGWPAIWFSRPEETSEDGRPLSLFGLFLRDAGWLLNGCPALYFLPVRERVEELCRGLFKRWPRSPRDGLPWLRLRLDDDLREAFGLIPLDGEAVRRDAMADRTSRLERLGWWEMTAKQMDRVWARYAARFGYPVEGRFRTPTPSINWDVSPIYLQSGQDFADLEANLAQKTLAALRRCTPAGQRLYALDWNHACYMLDPHGEVAGEAESWAVPVLPNGDSTIFLTADFRFGLIGDCVEHTICVFGRPLLDALEANPPTIFRKRALTAEAREVLQEGWESHVWRRLDCDDRDKYRDGFYEAFDFSPPTLQGYEPCFREPCPSVTWDISGLLQTSGQERETLAAELTLRVLAALQRATPSGETLVAIDVLRFYEHYAFDPHRLTSPDREQWAHSVLPDDNCSIFLARDFRFGLVGDPVRQTLCVFGQPLLDAFVADLPAFLGNALRRDGREVAG